VGLKSEIIRVAVAEWKFFGSQELISGQLAGGERHQEDEPGYAERVGDYWRIGAGDPSLNGTNRDQPWSAAFVSYVMRVAGVGQRDFPSTASHSEYIKLAVSNRLATGGPAAFVGLRINERALLAGDILCFDNPDFSPNVSYDNCLSSPSFRSHGDIVVARRLDRALLIGGNVHQAVTLTYVPITQTGLLAPEAVTPVRPYFVVVANNLP
jgi:hypothetical protein